MKEPKKWCVAAAGGGLIAGLMLGFSLSEGTVRNANIFLRHGGLVSHVHLIDCHVIANGKALEINVENNRVTETPGFLAAQRAEDELP